MVTSPRQLPYAPTPHSYIPNSAISATINLDEVGADLHCVPSYGFTSNTVFIQEVKLSNSAAERNLYDSLAEIYGIIVTLDGLDKAYIKDSIPEAEYTEICSRLLKQYKSSISDETVAPTFVDLETFKREWNVCPNEFIARARSDSLTDEDRLNALGPQIVSG